MEKILMLIISLIIGCSKSIDNKLPKQNLALVQAAVETSKGPEAREYKLTEGLVRLSGSYKMGSTLYIYNTDGSLWKSTVFINDGKSDTKKLAPFSFHPDYFLLVFRCLETQEDRYKVIVNEETEDIKYIKSNDPNFIFESWENHIVNSVFAVGFNPEINPVKEKPESSSHTIPFNRDEFYHPNKMHGSWLQVKWGTEGKWQYGWIEWKKKSSLVIELFYFA